MANSLLEIRLNFKTLLAIKNIIGLGYAHAKDIFVNGIFYGSW